MEYNKTIDHTLLKQDATEQQVIELCKEAKEYDFMSVCINPGFVELSKKEKGVRVLLLTKTISKQISLDVQKANEQYGNFEAKTFTQSHDRFLIIDQTEVYHLGASLKDLGKKWFAFSKIDKSSVESIMNEISELI